MEDIQQLGGNIELAGFRNLDGGSMIILKKIIGNYARKFSDRLENMEKLSITIKTVGSNQYEMKAKLVAGGEIFNSEVTDHNLFVLTDSLMKKIESSALK
ncbi:hypothetical protein KY304_02730 [Candidatus Woesearchaeota archaeon]|nr:hypothetical protein [Candidatus Woesearchaeota archaeon]MBW2979002.1 hypothetical protein [Candidatus Woesearchaeota archaeon]